MIQITIRSLKPSTGCLVFHITVVAFTAVTTSGKKSIILYCYSEVFNFGDRRWYNCNDSSVSRISSPDTQSSSAYVLFYVMEDWVFPSMCTVFSRKWNSKFYLNFLSLRMNNLKSQIMSLSHLNILLFLNINKILLTECNFFLILKILLIF